MSVNDMKDMDLTPVIVVVAIIMAIIIPLAIKTGKKTAETTNKEIFGTGEGTLQIGYGAKIVAKRTTPHPLNKNVLVNRVVFELRDGKRIELAIQSDSTYGSMVEGDVGVLKYQGNSYVSFQRGI